MNAEQAWQSVLGQLQMEMPRASFDTWVRDTKPVSYQDGTLTIGVRNAYCARLAGEPSRQYCEPFAGWDYECQCCGQLHREWE